MAIDLFSSRGAIVDPTTGLPTRLFYELLNELTQDVVTSEDITDSDLLEIGLSTSPATDPSVEIDLLYYAGNDNESPTGVPLECFIANTDTPNTALDLTTMLGADQAIQEQDLIAVALLDSPNVYAVAMDQGVSKGDIVSFACINANANATESGVIAAGERSSDPADPPEGEYVIWMSDGTGSGDDGDIMFKITAGAVTKTGTLIDFSTV